MDFWSSGWVLSVFTFLLPHPVLKIYLKKLVLCTIFLDLHPYRKQRQHLTQLISVGEVCAEKKPNWELILTLKERFPGNLILSRKGNSSFHPEVCVGGHSVL